MLSVEFNDPTFAPVTEELPELHSDFICSELLEHALVKDLAHATPEKCQGKFASMIVQMNRCIAKWERSGQGEGGGMESESDDEEDVQGNPGDHNIPDSAGTGAETHGDTTGEIVIQT